MKYFLFFLGVFLCFSAVCVRFGTDTEDGHFLNHSVIFSLGATLLYYVFS